MAVYCGIVYGPSNSPLYCEVEAHTYFVINGHWRFEKNGTINGMTYRKVIRDMQYYADYNEACQVIREAAMYGEFEANLASSIISDEDLLLLL